MLSQFKPLESDGDASFEDVQFTTNEVKFNYKVAYSKADEQLKIEISDLKALKQHYESFDLRVQLPGKDIGVNDKISEKYLFLKQEKKDESLKAFFVRNGQDQEIILMSKELEEAQKYLEINNSKEDEIIIQGVREIVLPYVRVCNVKKHLLIDINQLQFDIEATAQSQELKEGGALSISLFTSKTWLNVLTSFQLSELIKNAFDVDADTLEIEVKADVIVVKDDGPGFPTSFLSSMGIGKEISIQNIPRTDLIKYSLSNEEAYNPVAFDLAEVKAKAEKSNKLLKQEQKKLLQQDVKVVDESDDKEQLGQFDLLCKKEIKKSFGGSHKGLRTFQDYFEKGRRELQEKYLQQYKDKKAELIKDPEKQDELLALEQDCKEKIKEIDAKTGGLYVGNGGISHARNNGKGGACLVLVISKYEDIADLVKNSSDDKEVTFANLFLKRKDSGASSVGGDVGGPEEGIIMLSSGQNSRASSQRTSRVPTPTGISRKSSFSLFIPDDKGSEDGSTLALDKPEKKISDDQLLSIPEVKSSLGDLQDLETILKTIAIREDRENGSVSTPDLIQPKSSINDAQLQIGNPQSLEGAEKESSPNQIKLDIIQSVKGNLSENKAHHSVKRNERKKEISSDDKVLAQIDQLIKTKKIKVNKSCCCFGLLHKTTRKDIRFLNQLQQEYNRSRSAGDDSSLVSCLKIVLDQQGVHAEKDLNCFSKEIRKLIHDIDPVALQDARLISGIQLSDS